MTNRNDEQVEPLSHQLMPIFLGMFIEEIIRAVDATFPTWGRLILPGVIYSALYFSTKHPKQATISHKTANILIIALVISILLVITASLISRLSVISTVFQIVWLVLMIVFVRFAQLLPATSAVPRSLLVGLASVCLGAGLGIGGVPIIIKLVAGVGGPSGGGTILEP